LLGAAFVFFGLNGFFQFMKAPPQPPGPATDFTTAMFVTHYFYVVSGLQVIGGALLVLGSRFVPLGLLLLGPILVNILCFHIFMRRQGLEIGIIFSVLALFLLWAYRSAFAGICPGNYKPQVDATKPPAT
jgi:hypothetical protein